ncbi:hypothetical protein QFC19_001345 [Naganishia cerealis]|uniref:Uncharacterized protein n=1 Tax=Naganishia cerealis TaxID=610337 RepID=A0ACC2WIE7_9TREE|nr:hypothetical protein QFC19_001345 [Naganishia cerealis]
MKRKPHPLTPAFSNLLPPDLLSPSEIPSSRAGHLSHQPASRESLLFYSNITGFYRKGKISPLNLTNPNYPIWVDEEAGQTASKYRDRLNKLDKFWRHLVPAARHGENDTSLPHIQPFVNITSFNHTLAIDKRGTWEWDKIDGWEISIKEREIIERTEDGEIIDRFNKTGNGLQRKEQKQKKHVDPWGDWAWVHDKEQSLTYDLTGVHHLSQGEFTFWGVPEEQLKKARDSIGVIGVGGVDPLEDDGYTQEMLDLYEAELANPSGIPIASPPGGLKMEGVGILDGCGIAFGLHDGEGMRFGVMIHRVQAPESAVSEPTAHNVAPRDTGGPNGDEAENDPSTAPPAAPSFSIMNVLHLEKRKARKSEGSSMEVRRWSEFGKISSSSL